MIKKIDGHDININLVSFGEHYTIALKIVAWTDPFKFDFEPTIKIDVGFIQTSESLC